jgi:uncharacterized MnhB-related membrane protein
MENIQYIILGLAAIFCAYRAVITTRLLHSSLYLACVSALVSVILYLLGATEVAVIELSVGAGLVTVLLVYALSVVGEDARDLFTVIPRPLTILVALIAAGLIGWMVYPLSAKPEAQHGLLLADVLWTRRALDVWVQIALIFSGVLGILGLLAESGPIKDKGEEGDAMQPSSARIAHQGAEKKENQA